MLWFRFKVEAMLLATQNVQQKGFSLVELSIVLVILGLLVGGILGGRSLIRAAELRATAREYESFQTATNLFRNKYMAFPGDMKNASAFWGDWNSDGTPAGAEGAMNGNGDGVVTGTERLSYFRHLSLAGLVAGSYSGNHALPAMDAIAGVNVPHSKLAGANLYINSRNDIYETGGNYLQIQAAAGPPWSILSPADAWAVDSKLDDGNPSSGIVFSLAEGAMADRDCTTDDDWLNAAYGSAQYKLELETSECWLLFWLH